MSEKERGRQGEENKKIETESERVERKKEKH